MSCTNQGTEFEFTLVQKFNQGSFPKSGSNRFRGTFFVAHPDFFGGEAKKKNTYFRDTTKYHYFTLVL